MSKMSIQVDNNQLIFEGSNIPLITIREGKTYITYCPILDDISGEANNPEESVKNFNTSLVGILTILNQDNKLVSFLDSCGWSVKKVKNNLLLTPPVEIKVTGYDISQIHLDNYAKSESA